MSDVIGRGVIEVSADSTKLKAGIEDAKRSLAGLGVATANVTASSSASIDRYVRSLAIQTETIGKSAREAELLKLGLRGATDAQLAAADSALRMTERHKEWVTVGEQMRHGLLMLSEAALGGFIAAAAAFDHFLKNAAEFEKMGTKVGDTAENMASLAVAAARGEVGMEAVVGASAKMTKALTGVDDESKAAGAAILAMGLDLDKFKQLSPADQFETVAKALAGFEDGTSKTAVVMALFGKAGAEMLPFLKVLGEEGGRQVILTGEQIRLAEVYHDKQLMLREQISLYASVIATEMLPAYNDLTAAFLDLIKGIAGVETGVKGLKNGNEIQDFAERGVAALAFLVDAFDALARLASVTTSAIGGTLAAVGLAQRLEFKQAWDVINQMDAQIKATLARPTLGTLVADQQAKRKANQGVGEWSGPVDEYGQPIGKPKLDFEGAQKKDTGAAAKAAAAKAAAEAKAQLAFDLEDIKKASEATIGVYSNADKIMQAMRTAGLIEDKQYYQSKLGFINLNSQEQEDALKKEIERMEQEKLVGKDRIDIERKIADARAQLAKVEADAVANRLINSIQEEAASKKMIQYARDSEIAATDYLNILRASNAVKLAGLSLGDLEISRLQGRLQIEKKYSDEVKALDKARATAEFSGGFGPEAQKKYDDELARVKRFQTLALSEYDTYFATLLKKQADWSVGAGKALANYYEESQNVAKQTEGIFTNAFKGMEDALVTFTQTGKFNFRSFADSVIAEITRMAIKQSILGPLAKVMGMNTGGFSSLLGSVFGPSTQAAAPVVEAVFAATGASASAGNPYIVGERGPELFIPNTAGTIVPNGSNGAISVTNVFHITGATDSRSQSQIAAAAGQGVQRALARNT